MNMANIAVQHKGALSAGARLLWRRQDILWWVFAVNVVLGALGTAGAARTLNAALGHSLAGNQLVKGFALDMFYELMRLPGANFLHSGLAALVCASLFAVFMLFVSGGILEVFRQDRRLTAGEFFAASGAFLWRFVRLTLLMLVPLAILAFAYGDLRSWSEYFGDKATADQVGFLILAAGIIVLGLMTLMVRVWFDIAKVRTAAENQRSMWRCTRAAFDITVRHLGTLLWMYLRISLLMVITLLIGFLIWTKLPPTATPATFILLEFMILSQLAARLWQLASATEWYKRYAEAIPAESANVIPSQPEELVETAPTPVVAEPDLPPITEPKTPPAEAGG